MKYYEVDNVNAVNIGSILFIGAILGSLFFGWFSDKIRSRKKPMILAAFGGCVSLSVLLYTNYLSLPIFELALFLTGFFSSVNIVSYALARDIYPNFSGLSIGILSTIFYAGSATSQSLVGFLLEYHSVNQNVDNLDNLSVTDFKFALSSLVVFMMMSIVISFFIKESVLKENKAHL
jgi:MFS family permease